MPLKILCLHGYRQNAEMFRQKTGSLRKVLKKYAEFYFVNAPHSLCLGDTDNNGDTTEGNADQRGWWFSRPNRNFSSRDVTDMDEGFEESLEVVKTFITTQGPFDGIMGFSQGASLAALIAALNVRNEFSLPGVKFLMLIAPFQSKSSRHGSLNATQISTPTLFICGANDNVILSSSTDDLKLQFSNLSELNHPGGHGLPASSQYKDEICGFLAKFLS